MPKFLGIVREGVKMFHFSSEIIFGQLLLTFGNFLLVTLLVSHQNACARCLRIFDTLNDFCTVEQPQEEDEAWNRKVITDKELFVAHLGPTGGRKGYGAITGEPPSEKSVCWWINGLLMPEIYVHRGKTYHFRVQVNFWPH